MSKARTAISSPQLALFSVAIAGILIRIRLYCFNRALWSDEALLALNVLNRNLHSLFTEPLDYGQAAPLGFMASVRILSILLGHHDYILRLMPFLASLGTLAAGFLIARKSFRSAAAQGTFLGLIAFSPAILYYSTEFKHYSLDVFFVMACLYCYMTPKLRWWGCGLLGAIGVWFSHPIVFILAAIGIALFTETLRKRAWRQLAPLAAVGFLWLLSFGINYGLTLHNYAGSDYLDTYWHMGYAPFPITNMANVRWFVATLAGLSYLSFLQSHPEGPLSSPEWFTPWNVVLMVTIATGTLLLLKRRPRLSLVILVTFFATLVASMLEVYPFRNRLVLFLVPLVFWIVSSLVESSIAGKRRAQRIAGWGIAAVLIGTVLPPAARVAIHPPNPSNAKTSLKIISTESQTGDAVAMNVWAIAPFEYYKREFKAGSLVALPEPDTLDPEVYLHQLRALSGGRIWVMHMHDMSAGETLSKATQHADFTQIWEGDRASVYRFEP